MKRMPTEVPLENEIVKHDANYLENNLTRINNIVGQYDYKYRSNTDNGLLNDFTNEKVEVTAQSENEIVIKGNSIFLKTEKNGTEKLLNSLTKLNSIISSEINRMLELKETYNNLDKSLIFDYDIRSELLDSNLLTSDINSLLDSQSNQNEFFLSKANVNPCIQGRTYTKDDFQKEYALYYNSPLSRIFDSFVNSNNEYEIPDIVFEKKSGIVNKYNIFILVDDEDTIEKIKEKVISCMEAYAGEKYKNLVSRGVSFSYNDGVLDINLSIAVDSALATNMISSEEIDPFFIKEDLNND
jgi:hypothetical protein